ncbi:hypothetical protein PM3016_1561 [Paenibacillus mucilaginosus 3016]|uniref:Methyltransferase domain-containing protein n=1 Tax=Paenibacillus mucilaginosus 3016 TaxID=1116391 RepID=H6N9V6_9BACL|nr:hypothetical protein [Paenibacillus mucilaginosus]AFC28484.1 hypothetical protein PM3016_1561 [Paenibacillus mucilaginosus 3016]
MLLKFRQQKDNMSTQNMWEDWQDFRNSFGSTLLKINELLTINRGRVLLLGAGNGNDVPIEIIEEMFEEIVLVDIDSEALSRFISKTGNSKKYTCIEADLSGIGHLIPDLKHKSERHIIELLESINYEPLWVKKITGKFDCVINCHYTSQLIAPIFMSRFDNRVTYPSRKYLLSLSNCSKRVLGGLFRDIHLVMSDGGIFIHSTDVFEVSFNSNGKSHPGSSEILKATGGDLQKVGEIVSLYDELMKKGYHVTGSEYPDNLKDIFEHFVMFINPWTFIDSDIEKKTYIVFTDAFRKK